MCFLVLGSGPSCARPFISPTKWLVLSNTIRLLLIRNKIYEAALALNKAINQSELDKGMLYPEITRIREVSVTVARQVIRQAQKQKLDREKSLRSLSDGELDTWIASKMYDPATHHSFAEGGSLKL